MIAKNHRDVAEVISRSMSNKAKRLPDDECLTYCLHSHVFVGFLARFCFS